MEVPTIGRLVPVYVPEDRVLDVYRYLGSTNGSAQTQAASAEEGTTPAAAEVVEEIGDGVAGTGWTEQEIVRDFEESPRDSMQPILKAMAARPGEVLTTDDFANAMSEHTGKPPRTSSVAGVLGAYGNRVKGRYGKSTWHFEAKWSDEASGVLYKMPAEVAEIIKAL